MIRKIALIAGAAWLASRVFGKQTPEQGVKEGRFSPSDAQSGADVDATDHVPKDLMSDAHPDGTQRADDHFRPDPTAPVDAQDREGLRPVTAPAPHDPPGR